MKLWMFVGSTNRATPYFATSHGEGVSVYSFDTDTGAHGQIARYPDIDNPTYMSVHADGQRVFANTEWADRPQGLVTSLAFDPSTNALSHLDTQPSRGSITSHSSISNDGRFLLVTNYAQGHDGPDKSVVVYPIAHDGVLGAPCCEIRHEGQGPNPDRQERSHAHFIHQLPSGLVVVADLGMDQIVLYDLSADGQLTARGAIEMEAGSGPRHLAWNAQATRLYCVNELHSSVTTLALDPHSGAAQHLGTISALAPASKGDAPVESHCSGIRISPDGRHVYVANRGEDTIAVFNVDSDGVLTPNSRVPSGGKTPRDLSISPCGNWVFACNQDSDTIAIFRRDVPQGTLTAHPTPIEVNVPMCAVLTPAS